MDLQAWIADPENFIPEVLDEAFQPLVFSCLYLRVKESGRSFKRFTPGTAQAFTTEFFLPFMAEHGYTLQKCRTAKKKRPQFLELKTTLASTAVIEGEAVSDAWPEGFKEIIYAIDTRLERKKAHAQVLPLIRIAHAGRSSTTTD